jgi:8-oxo-dGTP pyrophosphatase MutT (NUDIX family)
VGTLRPVRRAIYPGLPFVIREFTVAVFVVHQGRVLLHRHKRLQRWLPPGGHIDAGELPDEAARRETREETGLEVDLVDAPLALGPEATAEADGLGPARLVQPLGIQLEDIGPGHQHIDLIYVARPRPGASLDLLAEVGTVDADLAWYAPEEWQPMGVSTEVQGWAEAAVGVLQSGLTSSR